ncbi:hypothetical protein [Flavobacterium sp. AJR]|uniref:hypothetical protein n=1 Tax=Flavobacterium sp. AJR TaxID=1979369 RepID=UPI000A3D6B13|nr:hypothetical protein [Flavobacterium sp. AJR]OUL62343.1 hypothetical protein B8T70_10445 [Flavobacterium sp. AJR]
MELEKALAKTYILAKVPCSPKIKILIMDINKHLPYIIRALLYHITKNMRIIYITKNKHEEFCLNIIFEEIPTQDEIELLIDTTGEMDCDLIFKNTTYNYLVTKESIGEILKSINNDFYLVYARNED